MNPLLSLDRQFLGDIYTSRTAMDYLEALCDDYGSRWGGTAGERAAAEFLERKLREFGLADVRREPFEYMGWTRGEAILRVSGPVERRLACISLPMCPPARLHGPLVWVGDGSPAEFEAAADRLSGALAMVSSQPPRGLNRTVHRSEKYQRSALAGAVGFLYVNQYEGYGPETGSIASDREALIPGVGISRESGELLLRLQRRHGPLTLHLETTDHCERTTSWNVVGELLGTAAGPEHVLIGCHYDGHDISQGAHDPASGTVALLEAARVLALYARHQIGCAVRFVLFGIEEVGLIGARRYVAGHQGELDEIRFMLNLDAAGGPGPKGLTVNRWPQLDSFWQRCAEEMAEVLPIGQRTSAFSDHFPFFMQGVPTAMMGNPGHVNTGRGFDHTAWDTVDKVRIEDLRQAAALTARLAVRISREEAWPARRRSAEETQALLAGEPSLEGQAVRAAMERLYVERASGA